MNNLENKLEALLFVSGDGVEISEIIDKWQVTDKQLDKAFENLKERFNENFGIKIIKYKNKYQLCSNPEFADDISNVLNPIRERNLSKATLETIAIIAYKQPITRLDIEQIRGVNSDYAIQSLLKHNLIEVVGRKDAIGKPLLFGTTEEFLKRFDLEDLSSLPNYDELINSIQVINQTTLYNEFDIPDEEADENIENNETNSENTNENDVNSEEAILTEEEIELLQDNSKIEDKTDIKI
ncbi:MAG: SMC-Scp complex subunit ScpB [Clostridiales bacterium]|nr:SMC-Scp complex subunit ScpB [Clostridiales bacterium]